MKLWPRVIFAALCTLLVAEGGWQGWHVGRGLQAREQTARERGGEVGEKRSIQPGLPPRTNSMRLRGGADEAQQKMSEMALDELPEFVQHRLKVYEQLKNRMASEQADGKEKEKIDVTLPDGTVFAGTKGKTSAWDVAASISKGLADNAVAALVDGETWDLHRALERDCTVKILKFDDEEGQAVFWHSSAHILGQALELEHGAMLVHGPALEDGGFFYDASTGSRTISEKESKGIEARMQAISKEKQRFERLVLTKEEACAMFSYNPFKLDIIANKVPDNATCTAYRCGPLIDLCRGPHVPHTGFVKAFEITKNAAAYWKGNASNPVLQRVYGISFPDKKKLKLHKAWVEEAKQRDHREIAKKQQLVMFHPLSPGCAFFLPHGTTIVNKLIAMLRAEYRIRGYKEVQTPNLFNMKLWHISGHAQHYNHKSYRELPLRLADFGVLHRNEPAGALNGLTRMIRFQQDDAHIFCTEDQIGEEIANTLDFISVVYGRLGLDYELHLSTRPEKFVGTIEQWDNAELHLQRALNLDFQLPLRFDLHYSGPEAVAGDFRRPVMIHRAVLGSVERMFAMLIEACAGKWPLWLSPRQCAVIPVSQDQMAYATAVAAELQAAGIETEADRSDNTLQKKIRGSQLAQFNYILVVGKEEEAARSVNVRTRDNVVHGQQPVDAFIAQLKEEVAAFK